jgi:hypothetical protein
MTFVAAAVGSSRPFTECEYAFRATIRSIETASEERDHW